MARKARTANVVAEAPAQPVVQAERVRHRTEPIPGTLTKVPRYPDRLRIYRLDASPYWWVRMFHDGKIYRKSTKTEIKRDAITIAQGFYNDVISGRHVVVKAGASKTTFASVAQAMLASMEAQQARGSLTAATCKIADYRLKSTLLPVFGKRDIGSIHFEDLEALLDNLSRQTPTLSPSTIASYMKLVRKVLSYAVKRRDLTTMPLFPTVGGKTKPRGYFTSKEYQRLRSRSQALVGKRFEYRKLMGDKGEEMRGQFFAEGECKNGRLIRKTTISRELPELVVFVTNSYVRPTDIKNLRHRHVEIIRADQTYLRLNPPPTKGHDKPFVTMESAVKVYEQLTAYNKAQGRGVGPDDYVFFPNYTNRDYALKELERQFAVLTWDLGFGKGPNDEERTIYSLRHTCFMFRLMKGDKIDHVTLAKNGRTSVEMIEKHYASQLQGEDNVDMLQSRRSKRKAAQPDDIKPTEDDED